MADASYLGWPFFEAHHRKLARDLEQFAADGLGGLGHGAQDDAAIDSACREIVRRLGQAGLLNHCCVPAAGDRFDVRSLALSRDVLSRHEPLADFAFAMQGLGTGPISLSGDERQRAAYLPPVMRGERIAAFALSEPQAGSDVGAIATTATRDGPGYVLNGTKTWISNGGIADHYVVFARSGEEKGTKACPRSSSMRARPASRSPRASGPSRPTRSPRWRSTAAAFRNRRCSASRAKDSGSR